MADRSESHNVERVRAQDTSFSETELGSRLEQLPDEYRGTGTRALLHLTRKPVLTPVPRPHSTALLAGSAFADANLPVVNVHVKRKKLELRGH